MPVTSYGALAVTCQDRLCLKLHLRAVTARLLLLLAVFFNVPSVQAAEPKIMVFGDSLAAGYGLSHTDSFPGQLQTRLRAQGFGHEIVNAGVSGDTTAGGLARLDWALADQPDFIILILGGNDMLRGLSPAQTREALDQILHRLKQRNIDILLCGMLAPANMGPDYAADFAALYAELAAKHDVLFYPFFLDGVALNPDLNQPDGLHPDAGGVSVIVSRIWPYILHLIG